MDDIKFEPLPKQIEEFEKKWTKNNPDRLPGYCHNIYHLISEDMNGNVTNEMFAVNCMTDYGFRSTYVNKTYWNTDDNHIYIGSGTSIPQTNSQSMETPISTTGSVNTNTDFTLSQQKFHPDTGILTCRFHLLSGYFNYTVFPEDKEVTEIGVGTSTTALYYHARVYDAQGNPSSFIKKLNERLTIHVYITGCMKIADIVNRAWNKGLYLQFEPHKWFRRRYNDWKSELVVCYDAYHNRNSARPNYWNPFDSDTRAIDGNVVTASCDSLGSRYIEGQYDYVCDVHVNGGPDAYGNYVYERYNTANHARFLFKPKLETPEKITCFELYTNAYDTSNISYIFGMPNDAHDRRVHGNLPVVDFDISGDDAGLWMYSCQDHDWTISETFVNAKDTAYDCDYIVYSDLIQNYYVEHLGDYTDFRVFLNTRPDIPITAFTLSGTATFYATDAWWDTASWEIIPNISSIPERLQTKRYYCTLKTDSFPSSSAYPGNMFGYGDWRYSFRATRTQPVHSITAKEGSGWRNYGWTRTSWRGDSRTATNSKVITNDEYGYVACADWLVYPDTTDPNAETYVNAKTSDNGYWYRYRLYGTGNAFSHPCLIWNTTKGDKIVVGGNTTWKNGFRVYDVNNDPTAAPTYQDYLFETSWGNDNPHWSFSNNGFVAASYISGTANVNRTYILDWYGGNDNNTPVMSYIDGYHHGHIIDLTDYICAINANVVDHLSLDVIDMKTKEVYRTIDIPEGYTFQGMCGWKNWIYIRVEIGGAYSTYLYYIDRQVLISLQINYSMMIIDGSSYYSHIQRAVESSGNCESCMVMIASDRDTSNQYHMLFRSSDPENPIRILADYTSSTEISRYSRNANVANQAAQLRYVNDNKQLLLAIKSRRGFVIDIGRILDEGTQTLTLDIHYWYNETASNGPSIGLYKDRAMYVMDYAYAGSIDGQTGYYWYSFYVEYYPIENFLPHKVIGYTRTINSYHNPKQIGGVTGLKIQLSNDVSIWDPQ